MDIILLCDPQNNSYELNALMWETTTGASLNNPISLSEISNVSSDLTTQFACVADGVSILTCSISIYSKYLCIYPSLEYYSVLFGISIFVLSPHATLKYILARFACLRYASCEHFVFALGPSGLKRGKAI